MATREFTDSRGVVWKVWDVTPTHLHPITRSEEYMEPWAGGWLTFESAREKRRLPAPYPSRWPEYELSQLEALCRAADPIGSARRITPTSRRMATVEDAAAETERTQSERTFTSPGGREWTVRIHECTGKDGTQETVLRFTAGDSVSDLKVWPEHWKDLTVIEYALLLLDALPPRRLGPKEHPQRRHSDRPA